MSQPQRIDIIIPTYNYGHFLDQCLTAVTAQTRGDFSVLVIDNASEDDTPEIMARWLKRDARVRYLRNDFNLGHIESMKKAYRLTSAEYVVLLPADDLWHPTFLEQTAGALDAHPECTYAYTGWRHFFDTPRDDSAVPPKPEADAWVPYTTTGVVEDMTCLTVQNWIPLSFGLFRRAVCDRLGGLFPEHLPQLGDLLLWMRLSALGKAYFISEPLGKIRYHGKNASHHLMASGRAAFEHVHVLDLVYQSDLWPHSIRLLAKASQIRLITGMSLYDVVLRFGSDKTLPMIQSYFDRHRADLYVTVARCILGWLPSGFGLGKLEEAIKLLKAAQEINPDHAEAKALLNSSEVVSKDSYHQWVEKHSLQEIDAELMAERMMTKWSVRPQFLILMPCRQADLPLLGRTIASLQKQFYSTWRLVIVADTPSPDPIFEQTDALGWLQLDSLEDDATLVTAINQVVESIPSDWLTILPAGSEFEPNWTLTTGDYINLHPEWAAIYTDDDLLDDQGGRHTPRLKPDFNLDYLRSMDYVGNSCWFRSEHLREIGGFGAFPGAMHYDVLLRLYDVCSHGVIGHIAEPLVHYPQYLDSHPLSEAATHAALKAHFQRTGTRADIEQGYAPGTRHIVYHHDCQPLVTIVIPNRDSYGFLKPCVNSLFEKTDYPAFEVIVVDNQSADPDVLAYYHEARERYAGRFRVIAYDHPFNFSAQCNLGVDQAAGEYILLLNNDTEIVQPAWLTRMMQFGQRPDVGIVGARLVYPENGGIQHAGVIVGLDRLAAHPYQGYTLENPGYMNRLHVDQDYSAVTAACMLIRRAIYREVGGMDADNLQALYNDIDLCLKTGAAGYRIVWTPHATVVHLEHKSLDKESRQQYEARDSKAGNYMHSRWQKELANDPAYNRHLSLSARDFSVDPVLVAEWDPNFHDRPRILAFPPAGGVGEYRFYAPLRGLSFAAKAQSTVIQTSKYHEIRYPSLPEVNRLAPDTLMRQISFETLDLEWLKFYRQHRPDILYVYMMDDLITEIPEGNPNYRRVPRDSRYRLRQLLAQADRLIVSTEPLVDLGKEMIDDVRLLPNRLRDDLWLPLRSQRRTSARPRIGWAGAQQHAGDLALIIDAVKQTANEADWVFFGMCPDELRPYVREYHEFEIGVEAYPAKLASLNLDLAIAPLEINRFNEAKSNLRILEYGALGLPVVCTDIFPYQTDAAPVKRVANDTAAWVAAIRERIHDLDATAREGDRLKEWVLNDYLLSQHLDDWLQALTDR
ncbi:MAG TPA: glycosyltransferase [Azospira sp.]|nr:glycosyltransferase [Azospira sp.]